jgi:hypothetical protein
VEFRVRRGEHNLLAGRPGEVTGRRGRYVVVRCTEAGTVHAELARLLQRAESDFIVRTVCDRLRRKHPGMFVATIHDSIVTNSRENAATILATMRDEFVKLGIEPKLEIEEL